MSSYEIIQADPTVRMPAGTYIVGDPCYNVPDDQWSSWLAAADPEVFGPGSSSHDCKRVLIAEVNGHPVLGIGTAHGDGQYLDTNSNRYPVDAGLIGLVPVELVAEAGDTLRDDLGVVRTFERPFDCSYEDGVIVLGNIRIDTDPEEESCYDCGSTYCQGYCQDEDEADEEGDE